MITMFARRNMCVFLAGALIPIMIVGQWFKSDTLEKNPIIIDYTKIKFNAHQLVENTKQFSKM